VSDVDAVAARRDLGCHRPGGPNANCVRLVRGRAAVGITGSAGTAPVAIVAMVVVIAAPPRRGQPDE
jgi:hypothetical protein